MAVMSHPKRCCQTQGGLSRVWLAAAANADAMHAARVTGKEAGQDNSARQQEFSHSNPPLEGRLPNIMVLRQTRSVVINQPIGVTLRPCLVT